METRYKLLKQSRLEQKRKLAEDVARALRSMKHTRSDPYHADTHNHATTFGRFVLGIPAPLHGASTARAAEQFRRNYRREEEEDDEDAERDYT